MDKSSDKLCGEPQKDSPTLPTEPSVTPPVPQSRRAAARARLKKAESLVKELAIDKDMTRVLLLKSRIKGKSSPPQALSDLHDAIAICKIIYFPEMSWQLYREIALIHQKMGDDGKAREYWEKASKVLKQITNRLEEDDLKYSYMRHPKRLEVMRNLRVYNQES